MSQTRDQKRYTISQVAADWPHLTLPYIRGGQVVTPAQR